MYNIGYFSRRTPQNNYYQTLKSNPQYSIELINDFSVEQITMLDVFVLEESKELNFTSICECLIEIRKKSDIHILILVDREQIVLTSRMVYLTLGADGIYSEEADEFDLIIKNILKRIKKETITGTLKKASFKMIPEKSCIRVNGNQEIGMTRQEYLIMKILYDNQGETVTYEDIYKNIWSEKKGSVQKNRVCNIVSHLRKKLAAVKDSPMQLKTIRSIGYILESSLPETEL
ncbi:winged helix-turn-helix domain-containing protein [Enterococcus crotali]|uniref:winged helix-turn-helix domain-containing protein n=1 Tax=Enterococcus crotali TaxID=1453587 RepID=UPI00046FBA10|nr:winged helix-turn-helix domain-containing protein [Enterococcus crotali]